MKKHSRQLILSRLRNSPLPATEWEFYTSSRKGLHVQINKLRSEGHNIVSVPIAPGLGKDRRSDKACVYTLIEGNSK